MSTVSTSLPEQIQSIVSKRLPHRIYAETRRYLEAARTAILAEEAIVLVGPPRAGKSSLCKQVFDIREPYALHESQDMPSVYVSAGNDSTGGSFSTKAFLGSCLNAAQHPLLSSDIAAKEGRLGASFTSRTTEGVMRLGFERCLVARRTQFLIVDEAHHVLNAKGGDSAAGAILDSLKVLAARTHVRLVLVGSYDLLQAVNLAPHLIGRSQIIEFPRYRDTEADRKEWTRIVRYYSGLIYKDEAALDKHLEYLHQGSWGCIGAFSRWIRNTLATCNAEGRTRPSTDDWKRSRHLSSSITAVLEEIRRGESHFGADQANVSGSLRRVIPAPESQRTPFKRRSRRNAI